MKHDFKKIRDQLDATIDGIISIANDAQFIHSVIEGTEKLGLRPDDALEAMALDHEKNISDCIRILNEARLRVDSILNSNNDFEGR